MLILISPNIILLITMINNLHRLSKSQPKSGKLNFLLYKICKKYIKVQNKQCFGEVAERLKALVLKTSNEATHSWVRIPPSPP